MVQKAVGEGDDGASRPRETGAEEPCRVCMQYHLASDGVDLL